MIDHLIGKPSPAYKRSQVFVLLSFWAWRLAAGKSEGPSALQRVPVLRRLIKSLTPWQTAVSILMTLYALRNADKLLAIGTPDPLANMYSPAFYRATWIATAFQAGALTALPIRPLWLRHTLAVLFAFYYLVYANEADEKVRKIRAVATVEQLKAGWEMSLNPIIRFFTRSQRPRIPVRRKCLIQRPEHSRYIEPIEVFLYASEPLEELDLSPSGHEVILDFPGGGFISMDPRLHEERLIAWAVKTKRLVISVNYRKAPEYPFPWAIEEGFDAYCSIIESRGRNVGLSGNRNLSVVVSGDSAGGNIACCLVFMALQSSPPPPLPAAVILIYPALDFNISSWMKPHHQQLLRSESRSSLQSLLSYPSSPALSHSSLKRQPSRANLSAILSSRDHWSHEKPLATAALQSEHGAKKHQVYEETAQAPSRRRSWGKSLTDLSEIFGIVSAEPLSIDAEARGRPSLISRIKSSGHLIENGRLRTPTVEVSHTRADTKQNGHAQHPRVATVQARDPAQSSNDSPPDRHQPLGTRLAMTSRVSFYNDRIIPPSLMRSMAILYLGPTNKPDFETDYYLSPILAPDALLAQFPRLILCCGEKDPFVDDTIIFAAKVRDAKAHIHHFGGEQNGIRHSKQQDVDIRILEGLSHGFLQMTAILEDARLTIDMLADCICTAFADQSVSSASGVSMGDGVGQTPTTHASSDLSDPTKSASKGVRYLDEKELMQRRREGVLRDMGSVPAEA